MYGGEGSKKRSPSSTVQEPAEGDTAKLVATTPSIVIGSVQRDEKNPLKNKRVVIEPAGKSSESSNKTNQTELIDDEESNSSATNCAVITTSTKDDRTKDNGIADSNKDKTQEILGGGEEEGYDMMRILSKKAITTDDPVLCNGGNNGNCKLAACVVYAPTTNPHEQWYYCLDCQETDFGGWPETREELPVKSLSKEHMRIMKIHCSTKKNKQDISMPTFLSSLSRSSTPKPSESTVNAGLSKKGPFKVVYSIWQKGRDETDIPETKIVIRQADVAY